MQIITISDFNERIKKKNENTRIPRENHENNENLRIPSEKQETERKS